MDAAELQWWAVADDMGLVFDPLLGVAQVRATVANAAGVKASPADFLPDLSDPGPMDSDALLSRFAALTANMVPRKNPAE